MTASDSPGAPRATVHAPVMPREAIELLGVREGGVWCDATVGGGGHAERILERSAPGGRLVGLDRDPDALGRAGARLAPFGDRVTLVHADFGDAAEVLGALGVARIDGLLADLGLSSDQLADAARGFSFAAAGPLDMRMDPTRGEPLAALLARWTDEELADVIWRYGEERASRRIARAVKEAERQGRLATTADLADTVASAAPRVGRLHPATRVFQALRMAVNDELGSLKRLLDTFLDLVAPGGRLVVIAFHSLEDRLVKHRLRELARPAEGAPRVRALTKKPLVPSDEEQAANPRARSAKLRAAEVIA